MYAFDKQNCYYEDENGCLTIVFNMNTPGKVQTSWNMFFLWFVWQSVEFLIRLLQICDSNISIKIFLYLLLKWCRNRIKAIDFCKILFAITHVVDSVMIKDQVHIKRSKHIKWLERIDHCVICVVMCYMGITKSHLSVNNVIILPMLLKGNERLFGLIIKHARKVESSPIELCCILSEFLMKLLQFVL